MHVRYSVLKKWHLLIGHRGNGELCEHDTRVFGQDPHVQVQI